MKRTIITALLFASKAALAASATLINQNDALVMTLPLPSTMQSVDWQLIWAGTGTVAFESTIDGSTWKSIPCVDALGVIWALSNQNTSCQTAASPGNQIRARLASVSGGSVSVVSVQSFAAPASFVSRTIPPLTATGVYGQSLVVAEEPITFLSFPYSINPLITNTSTAAGGTVSQTNAMALLQTSSATTGTAQMESRERARYMPGQGQSASFTAVYASGCVSSSTQEEGLGDSADGFFFGCNGSSFGINRRQNGSDNWVPQTAWNFDRMDGTGPSAMNLDITKGNIYKLAFAWHGFGPVRFFIMDQTTSKYVLVHTIFYPNTATTPTVFNPSLPLHVKVANSGNASNLQMYIGSMGVQSEGPHLEVGQSRQSADNQKASIGTSPTSVFTIKNATTFNGKTNRTQLHIDQMSFSVGAAGSNDAVFRLIHNATTATSTFVDINTATSVVSVDVSGTSTSGGHALLSTFGTNGSSDSISLADQKIFIAPGETLSCVAFSRAATVTASCGLSWNEEF